MKLKIILHQKLLVRMLMPLLLVCASFNGIAQPALVYKNPNGIYDLTQEGASYFAKLSLKCAGTVSPHFYERIKEVNKIEDSSTSKDLWPSFYGCFDWHSSVHNHWCLVKLLKRYPNIREADQIRARLNEAFSAENLDVELYFLQQAEDGLFEFPYGQSWFLKLADELKTWNDPLAERWLIQMQPLLNFIEQNHLTYWKKKEKVRISGSHDSPAMGISFALDYSRSFQKKELEEELIRAAKKYYLPMRSAPILQEPVEYDFMSGTLLICDLMRKLLTEKEYLEWLSKFTPSLLDKEQVSQALKINRTEIHDGYESHWDGFHLNRIWCLNGMLTSLSSSSLNKSLRKEWISSMNDMWDYAQESIGKGNYDVDHWLSSFSVFALCGYKD